MKPILPILLLATSFAALAAFDVPWRTVDGGGGVSAATIGAATWKVTGTIGQPDDHAGSSANTSGFALSGGYWAIAIPTDGGGPQLTIIKSGIDAKISWGADAVGYKLQYSDDLLAWTDQPGTITGASFLYWSLGNGPRYYFRLKKL